MLIPVIAISVILLLMPMPQLGRTGRTLSDLLHTPCFAILAAIIYAAVCKLMSRNCALVAICCWVVLAGFGFASEAAQQLVGRSDSLHDALANVLGITAGMLIVAGRRVLVGWQKHLARTAALILIAAGLSYPVLVLYDIFRAHRDFPQLATFERTLEFWRWTPHDACFERSERYATEGTRSGRLDLYPAQYPGVVLTLPDKDWSTFERLKLDITWAGAQDDVKDDGTDDVAQLKSISPLQLIVKITDLQHNQEHDDRFHKHLQLTPGKHTIEIPLSEVLYSPRDRRMNLSAINLLQIFARELKQPTTVYLDNIYLE